MPARIAASSSAAAQLVAPISRANATAEKLIWLQEGLAVARSASKKPG